MRRYTMLSLEDIVGMCDCTKEEVEAIAMHEHVPDTIASEMAAYLIHCPDGVTRIRKIILEDIEYAENKGHLEQARKLNDVLIHFIATHPDYPQRASNS